ncbi:hypothetical protein [Fibrobacter succinogenes]|uniref:hypothetical protein n=1 Tax=Fibrobacter succinogenes TaxID=833 RepID=UPI0013D59A3C|nr:hypothetical protein [Fibrobacter succinogenes]
MIHLNLIDAAERLVEVETVAPVNVTSVKELQNKSRKKILTVVVAALLVFVAFSCFLSVAGVPKQLQGLLPLPYLDLIGAEDPTRSALAIGVGQKTSAGGSLEAEAAAAAAMIRQRENVTVKQVVGEINPQALFNNKRTDYNSYLPLEKLSFQKASVGQFFAFLNTATPDDVGFSDCIYQAPNYFYVRGVAGNPNSQKAFLDRIRAVSSDFRTPPLPENAPATDITAFGMYNVSNVNLTSVSSFVPSSEASNEVKSMKALAATQKVQFAGLDKPVIEEFGVYKRYTLKATTTADFAELNGFITAFVNSPSRIGIRNVEMKLAKKDMFTTVLFEMFVIK